MQLQEQPATSQTPPPVLEAGTYKEAFYQLARATFVEPQTPPRSRWSRALVSPLGVAFLSCLLMVALVSFSLGATAASGGAQVGETNAAAPSSPMQTSTAQAVSGNVPNATRTSGGQLAHSVLDRDGARHFTLTARQVMWEVVKGQRVLAWTIDGTVPGPTIRVTVGEHVRITLLNHLPEATALHWHGLEVPSNQDGVPGVGMQPIQPGETYTYDFVITGDDLGTHWYHSHYNDLEQVAGGLYGAFLVDPRPGTPQAAQAIKADVEYNEFIGMLGGYYVINGKSFPDTQPIQVRHGQIVHLRLFGVDTAMIHPMHLHGHVLTLLAEDGHLLPQPVQRDTLSVEPGSTYDLTFSAWAAAGSMYPFHCHILSHLMNPGQTGHEMGGLIVLVEYAK